MEILKKVRQKITRQHIGLAAAVIMVVLTFLVYLPPHYSWYFWQRKIFFVVFLLTGIFQFLIAMVLGLSPGQLTNDFSWVDGFVVGIAAVVIGNFVYHLVKDWRSGIVIFSFGLVFNLCGAYFSFAAPVDPPVTECDIQISDTSRVKALNFQEGATVNFFLLSSTDNGESWNQFLITSVDTFERTFNFTCDDIDHLDDDFIWVSITNQLLISKDGGETWEIKHLRNCDTEFLCFYQTRSVQFEDVNNGVLHVFPGESDTEYLRTTDGGDTWVPVDGE